MQTRNENDPKPVQELMGKSTLAAIVKKAQVLAKIEECLPELLNKTLSHHCCVLNIKDHCLILASDNSAVATQIRYREEEILRKLHKLTEFVDVNRIECVVRPS